MKNLYHNSFTCFIQEYIGNKKLTTEELFELQKIIQNNQD